MGRRVRWILLLAALAALAACAAVLLLASLQGAPQAPALTMVLTTGAQPSAISRPSAGITEPTSGPAPTASLAETIRAEFERLAAGRILYNPPAEMQVGRQDRIEARVSMDPAAELGEDLEGTGAPQVEAIPVSAFMKVRLVGDAFDIAALSSEEQLVPDTGYSEWVWDVTPLKSGDRTLSLIVTARLKLPGMGEEHKDLGIIEREIHIKVNPTYSLASWLRQNQGWIYTAVLLPVVVALGRWLWKRYKGRRPPGTGSAGPGRDGVTAADTGDEP